MEKWLELARGPLFQFAFLFMVLGLLRHLLLAVAGTIRALRRAGDRNLPYKAVLKATLDWMVPVRKLKGSYLLSALSIVMHAGLILLPVFLFSHVALWKRSLGIGWPALPLLPSDVLTLLTIAAIFALLAMRIVTREGRGLSRVEDYALLIVLAVPFISGYLALHPGINPFSYNAILLVHVLSGDLVFILMPLTKLSHAVLMPATQVFAEAAWHFPQDSGRKVAMTLNKEEEPI